MGAPVSAENVVAKLERIHAKGLDSLSPSETVHRASEIVGNFDKIARLSDSKPEIVASEMPPEARTTLFGLLKACDWENGTRKVIAPVNIEKAEKLKEVVQPDPQNN